MSWLGGEPAGTQRWVWDGPMGRLQGTFQLPLAHPALPYPPWGVSGLQAMLPYPQCFLKKQNIPVHLHCCFALKGGKKKKIFFFSGSTYMGCTFVHLHMQTCVHTQEKQFYIWFNRLFPCDLL